MQKISKSREKWQAQLTSEQFRITRDKGTERAYTGEYVNCFLDGIYHCVCCGNALFDSRDKYDANCGWPCFTQPLDSKLIVRKNYFWAGMERTEISCHRCDAHLGHVFDDRSTTGALRYCLNSTALKLRRTTTMSSR